MTDFKAMKINYVCKKCGSDHVGRDSFCDWNVETQQWEVANFMEESFCLNCETTTELEQVTIEEESQQ